MTELGIKAAAAQARADLDKAMATSQLATQAKLYAEANRINSLLNVEKANIQERTNVLNSERDLNRARAELTFNEGIGQKYKNDIIQLDSLIRKGTFNDDLVKAKAYTSFEAKNAKDIDALYDNYAEYYNHKPGQKSTASKFERKFGWYYSPYLGDAAKRELAWKGWQKDTTLGTIGSIGNLIGGAGKAFGGITQGLVSLGKLKGN